MVLVAAPQCCVVAVVLVSVVMGRARRGVAQRGGHGGGFDRDDTSVHDLTVDLHHHLVALRRV